ncbi:MAG: putative selenium-dependent hydroxylase accessory protein YqeC [Proteobacteria bacterium]|nr:putative selenium-dependent hydroxylase accessory protein YqeC [Pseudomonadota bacterium]
MPAGRRVYGRFFFVEADGAAGRPLKAPRAGEPVVPVCAGLVAAVVGASGLGRPLVEEFVWRPEIFARLTGLPLGGAVDARAVARVVVGPGGLLAGAPKAGRKMVVINQVDGPAQEQQARELAEAVMDGSSGAVERVILTTLRTRELVGVLEDKRWSIS